MKKNVFLEKSLERHGNIYNYDMVPNTLTLKSNVTIICNKHGKFNTLVKSHINGVGCRQCKIENKFIEKSKKKHGDIYNYDKLYYIDSVTNITIICPFHGDFQQNPSNHMNGSGCPLCYGTVKYSLSDFVKKSRDLHGDLYDYSKVEYKSKRDYVTIICKEHGEFSQRASDHYTKSGCPKCSGFNLSREDFIEIATVVHGQKYLYNNMNYVNMTTPVMITCKEHGDFKITPSLHKSGIGCKICNNMIKTNKVKDKFIKKSKLLYMNKYTYDNVKFIDMRTPVMITCKEHGDFSIIPNYHIYSSTGDCPLCNPPKITHYTTETFIERAKDVHGDLYSYDKVDYKKSNIPVIITCKKHGDFLQKPVYHLSGSNCQKMCW